MRSYVHFGSGTKGPFLTQSVPVKNDGKGNASRTDWLVLVHGHWRRVLIGYGTFCKFQGEKDNHLAITLVA